jgi:hypothetical protein
VTTEHIPQTLSKLTHWLETMRQKGGYGGPVAHWWGNRYSYTGPGLDWRYEGIFIGYATLLQKSQETRWCKPLCCAAKDLLLAQQEDGSYRASRFEINPGTLGTPHEAAATLGLLEALPYLGKREHLLEAAKRNLDNLIARLWDGEGFNDRPGISGRVPNKLATLAQTLMTYAVVSGDERYLHYARAALEDVLSYQVMGGCFDGAVHQYAPGCARGDGRFFPYYAARCVPPLVLASSVFAEPCYKDAAKRILGFLQKVMEPEGSWPQIVYASGRRAEWPRWLAGAADILLAYVAVGEPLPAAALTRLLESQLPSGGIPTAEGFRGQIDQRPHDGPPDYRDVTPVVGWNDKVLRLLSTLLEVGATLPRADVSEVRCPVTIRGALGDFSETEREVRITAQDKALYWWVKCEPWARVATREVDLR